MNGAEVRDATDSDIGFFFGTSSARACNALQLKKSRRKLPNLERYISLDVDLAMVGYSRHNVFAQLFARGFSA